MLSPNEQNSAYETLYCGVSKDIKDAHRKLVGRDPDTPITDVEIHVIDSAVEEILMRFHMWIETQRGGSK